MKRLVNTTKLYEVDINKFYWMLCLSIKIPILLAKVQ